MGLLPRLLSVSLLLFITFFLAPQLSQGYFFLADTTLEVNSCRVSLNKCGSECGRRCSATSHKQPCLMFCKKCCQKCLCVPPGTYGNKECCACYDDWKTKRGGPKCP